VVLIDGKDEMMDLCRLPNAEIARNLEQHVPKTT
jgi:hypothetical protein